MAEGVGFEPTGRLHAQRFSRPPLSAAQPSLRLIYFTVSPSRLQEAMPGPPPHEGGGRQVDA